MDPRPFKPEFGAGVVLHWIPPADIVAVVLFVVLTDALLISNAMGQAPLNALFALPLLLFVPGYVLLAAVFPHRAATDGGTEPTDLAGSSTASNRTQSVAGGSSIGLTERAALSFGLSIALIPLIGLGVAAVTGSLSPEHTFLGVNVFVFVGAAVGIVRRNHLPKAQRFRVPYRRWIRDVRTAVFGRRSRIDGALTVLLLVSAVAAASTMGFTLLAPLDGESYTSATLVTENAEGEYVASGYPTAFEQGHGEELVVRLDNNEGVDTTYTVVAELQRVDTGGDSVRVTAEDVIVRERNTVAAGDTWLASHTVTPTMTGEDLRLAYYVYRGDAPQDPDEESAYRNLYLWVDVSDSTESE